MFGINAFISSLKGDKSIWAIISLLALFSFLPVYSASSNLVYIYGRTSTFSLLLKHLGYLIIGFSILYFLHTKPYHRLRFMSKALLFIIIPLLVYTLLQGKLIGGANASRWITIPFIGVSFQTSSFAFVVIQIYVARYLAKYQNVDLDFKHSLLRLWIPVFLVVVLVLPANFSTAALIFLMVLVLVFVSGYSLKYLGYIIVSGALFLTLFIVGAKTFPDAFPNRVDTWINRIENFTGTEDEADKDVYQVEKAKTAIATGGLTGLGPGKSLQKNFLPQSSSDFIYAIVIEEYGLVFGVLIAFLYMLLLFRFIVQAGKAPTTFGRLLILGLGVSIIVQALINMSVAVNLLPVTGQTLPFISSGGSSLLMTCVSLGIILSVTNREEVLDEPTLKDMDSEDDNGENEALSDYLIQKIK